METNLHSKRWSAVVVAAAVLGLAVSAPPALAAGGVDAGTFHLQGARSEGGVRLPSSQVLPKGAWDLSLGYAHEGEVLHVKVPTDSIRGGSRSRDVSWLDSRDSMLLQFAVSPFDRLEVAAGLPMLVGQTVTSERSLEPPRSGSTTFGDLRLGIRYALWGAAAPGWGATLHGALLVPSGGSEFGVGDSKARADAAGSFGFRSQDGWSAHLHAGHLMGQPVAVGDQLLGDTAYGGLLLQFRHAAGPHELLWSAEAVVSSVLAAAPAGTEPRRDALELLLGARYFVDAVYFDVGGGYAPVDDGVTPLWRVLAAVGVRGLWEPAPAAPPPTQTIIREVPVVVPAARRQEVEPEQEVKQADPKETFRTLAVEERAIFFEVGRADLDDISRSLLRTVALNLLSTDRRLVITGFADDQGSKERNEELSRRRAETVRGALVDAGVDESRLQIVGAGDTSPVAPSTGFGRSINRRVTFSWVD